MEKEQTVAYEAVLADLRDRKEREIQEITRRYDTAIAGIENLISGGMIGDALPLVPTGEVRIAVGEFHGMPFTSAARSILERTNKRALRTDEMIQYIIKSGKKIDEKKAAATLYSSLKRNQDFELVAPNTWGLAEWYDTNNAVSADEVEVPEVEEEAVNQ